MRRCEKCPLIGPCEYEGICMCGDPINKHSMWCGHSPVAMHDYLCEEVDTTEVVNSE